MNKVKAHVTATPVAAGVAPGYSQVKITTATPTANGLVNQEQNSTTLMNSKKDRFYGLDHLSHGEGNADDTGGGTTNNANLVSTVNVGNKAQQQQQQQQHGSSFSTAKLSSTPAATSAVTSVSTLKKHPPQQSSSTLSSDVVSSPGTNARPTSTVPRVAHVCCRCGLQPAAVSVASSSRTMAPQKLCSDCRNQPVTTKNGEGQIREAANTDAEPTTRMTTGTKQPESFSVVASTISTAKADLRSGVSTSEAQPKIQTNETAKGLPQTVKDDSSATKNNSSSTSLTRSGPRAGLAANRKSTIEVRRRSNYGDNRTRTATSSTQDNDRCLTTDTAGTDTGSDIDQAVRSTNVQTANFTVGSKARQTSDVSSHQRSPVNAASAETKPPNATPEVISEVVPVSANSGSNMSTDNNAFHDCGSKELGQQGTTSSLRYSAPTIEEIHPLPCSNPPYNPDFHNDNTVALSSTERHRFASDTSAIVRLNLNTTESGSREQLQRKQQSQNVPATTSTGAPLPFLLSNSRHHYPSEHPPKYEDIIHEKDAVTATAPDASAAGNQTQLSQTVLPMPTESFAAAATSDAMRLVRSFGKYGEISTQPGAFRTPRQVSVSPATAKEGASTRVVVSDAANGTVQVFGESGECLSMLRADAVRGCCLLDDSQRLLLATSRGVEVSCTVTTVNFTTLPVILTLKPT